MTEIVRLAIAGPARERERLLAALIELAPAGFEETAIEGSERVEFALYGAPGELPELAPGRATLGDVEVEVRCELVPGDWADRWRRFHRAVRVAGIHVRPPWEPRDPSARVDVEIDPGRAFGTGAHATTRLCLRLLSSWLEGGEGRKRLTVCDIGCGSGVLGLVARALGVERVLACDHDRQAVEATRANARRNRLELAAIEQRDALRDELPVADLYLANLTGPVLQRLAPRLPSQAWVAASGFLCSEEAAVTAAFAPRAAAVRMVEDEWCALLFAPLQSTAL